MNKSVAISILCNGTIKTQTVSCLLDTFGIGQEIPKTVGFIAGGYPAYSRNLAVERARALGVTHLMFLDADQTFPRDAIQTLFNHEKDIVAGNYNQRGIPLVSVTKQMGENGELLDNSPVPKELFKAFSIGTGFCLIDMKVFDTVPFPWFNTQVTIDKNGKTEFMSEDVYFCINARAAGFDIWCDPKIPIGHLGTFEY